MSISYVGARYIFKHLTDLLTDIGWNLPEGVGKLIITHHMAVRLIKDDFLNLGLNVLSVLEGQEHRASVGSLHVTEVSSVFFLLDSGELVFLDSPLAVVLYVG